MTLTKEKILKSVEEAKKIRLEELKNSRLIAAKYPILTERQRLVEKIKRRQNEVIKFVSFLKRKVNES